MTFAEIYCAIAELPRRSPNGCDISREVSLLGAAAWRPAFSRVDPLFREPTLEDSGPRAQYIYSFPDHSFLKVMCNPNSLQVVNDPKEIARCEAIVEAEGGWPE